MAESKIDPDLERLLVEDFGYEPNVVKRIAYKALSPVGKILDVADTGLNVAVNVLRPVITAGNPELEELYESAPKKFGIPNITFSDILESSAPKGATKGDKVARAILGFGLDVAFDPLSYLTGVGAFTKTGRVTKIVEGAVKAGESISPISKVGREAVKLVGEKPTATGIKKARKQLVLGESLADQAQKKQRALISIGFPFTGQDVPLVYGSKILSTFDKSAKWIRDNPGKAFNKLFSTSSGNPKFDVYRDDMVSMGKHLANVKKMEGKDFARKFDQLVKDTGEEPEFLKRTLLDLEEVKNYGNYSAMSILKVNAKNIKEKLYDNPQNFEKVFKTLKGISALNQKEKGKLYRTMLDEITSINTFGNPYTLGFRQLPVEFRSEFAKEIAKQSGIYTLKSVGKKFNQYVDFGKVLDAYTRGRKLGKKKLNSADSVLLEYVGKAEFQRIKAIEDLIRSKNFKGLGGVGKQAATEIGALRSAISSNLAHIDEAFTMNYMMYNSHPEYLKKINPTIHAWFNKINAQSLWKIQSLIDQFHMPKKWAAKYPDMYNFAQTLRREGRIMLQEQQLSGVPIKEFIGDIHHVSHIPTKEIREFLQENYPKQFTGASKEWTTFHVNQLQRKFATIDKGRVNEAFNYGLITKAQRNALVAKQGKDYLRTLVRNKKISREFATKFYHFLTVSEVNNLAKGGKLKVLGNKPFDKFFEDNPLEVFKTTGARSARAITSGEFFEGAKQFGKLIPNAGRIAPEGLRFSNYAPLNQVDKYGQRLAFDPEVAKHIDSFKESLELPAAAHPFIEKFDVLNDLWKAWTLAIYPVTHLRDLIGNVYNNYLAGMNTPSSLRYYTKAMGMQKRTTIQASERMSKFVKEHNIDIGKPLEIKSQTNKLLTEKELVEEARRHGVIDMLWFHGDVEKYFEIEAKSALSKLAKGQIGDYSILDAGLGVKKYSQNNANLAHYLWKREQGFSAVDAAASVKKYQFDYSQLTNVEKSVFRRVIPFYTWTRKNVPLQLESLVTAPNKPMGVNKFIGSFVETNYDGTPDERYLPDWMIQNFPVRVRKNQTTGNFEYFLLGSWLPLADIDKIFHPVRFVVNSLSPFLKEPIQQVANKDFYYNREIDQGDEYERFLGRNMPKRVTHLLRNLRILNESDKLFFTPNSDTEAISNSTKLIRALIGKIYPFDPELQRQFQQKDYKRKESRLKANLKKAVRKGDDSEQDRLQRRIEQLVEEAANKAG